jgi:hypothetical protein
VDKNSLKWTGRKITIGSLKLNPFYSSVYIKDLKVYEADNTNIFFDCHDIYLKVDLKKILNKDYVVDKVKIDNPEISIIQNGNSFNFDDLLKHFSSDTTKKIQPKSSTELHYTISNVVINSASIIYNNVSIHNIFEIHELNLNLPELTSDKSKSKLHIDFNYGTGGHFNIDLLANLKTLDYDVALSIDKYDLSQYYAPINAYMKVSSLKGSLSTNIRLHGKFNSTKDISMACDLYIKDVEIKDPDKKRFFSLGEFSVHADTINIKQNMFIFRSILLDKPYVALDEYAKSSNISELFRPKPEHDRKEKRPEGKEKIDNSNIFALLESSIKSMAIDFLAANYHADSIIIHNGEFAFNDFTPHHNFHYYVSNINLSTDEIGPKNKEILLNISAALNDTGRFAMKANLDYDLKKKLFSYNISELDISDVSPIAKYMLEKNSVKWTGRRITTGNIKLDPLKGSVFIKDIKIYEPDSTNVFFDCHDVFVKVNLTQMLGNTYQVDQIKIDNPEIRIAQNGNHFNFDDLVKRFSADTTKNKESGPPLHYDINNVSINNGNITYNNIPIHDVFRVHELNLSIPELSWDNPQSKLHLDFNYGIGGAFNVDLNFNRSTSRYTLDFAVDSYDISQYYAPLNSFLRISSLRGSLSTNLRIHGRFNNPQYISGTGYIHLNDLEIQDTAKQKVFGLGELALDIDTMNVKHGIYSLNNVLLDRPYMRFDYYTNGNNISQMIKYTAPPSPVRDTSTGEVKPDYSNIFTLIASSLKMMAVDFVNTNYHTDSVIVRNGQFEYNDYTLNSPFHYNVSNINITTDKISSNENNLLFKINATLNDSGSLVMTAGMSLDFKDMLLDYDISNLRIADFNPYTEYYVGTPFLDGYLKYHSTDSVVNRYLKSSNVIHIAKIKAGKKTATKPVYNLPVHMAVSLLKDEKDNIDLKLPAKGNLDDPDYKLGPVVGHMTSELIVKTAESPFRVLAKIFNKDPEDMKQIQFDYMQDKFSEKQLHKLEDIYKVLEKKKDLMVEITQVTDSLAEKDELALELAKKEYYDETKHTVNDSLLARRKRKKAFKAEEKIATQDTLFDKYLNEKLKLTGNELMTVEDKCIKLVGDSMTSKQVHEWMESRNKLVMEFLVGKKGLDPKRVKVMLNKDPLKTENMSQPAFEINYKVED